MTRTATALCGTAVACCLVPAPASALGIRAIGVFDQPVYVAAPPRERGRLFIVERRGRIRVVRHGRVLRRPFLDITETVRLDEPSREEVEQRGLLSMAFSPGYRRSGRFYVFYTGRDGRIHVDEFRRSTGNPNRAVARSRRALLSIPSASRLDIGGQLQFGPDHLLYIGVGYGDDPESSQDLSTATGKLLRIDPRPTRGRAYRVPASNPFVSRPGARPEIFAYGLRVPWRFSFDRRTGSLALADVGGSRVEEVNLLRRGRGAGSNFGWPVFEGRTRIASGTARRHVAPVLTWPHRRGTCAIVGGYVVRDRSLRRYAGRYVYGDVCTGRVRSARLRLPRARGDRSERLRVPYLVSFGEGTGGRLYAVSFNGRVYRVRSR